MTEETTRTSHGQFLARYKQLRAAAVQLSNALLKHLPKDVVNEGGKNLGILRRGILVFDSESAMAVLMDHCIYDVRRQGRNAVERYLADSPPAPDSDEMVLLTAMKEATFSFFVVEAVEPGIGVQVRDLFNDETRFIMDVGLGQSAQPGLLLGARLTSVEGFSMTTGAPLPLALLSKHEQDMWVRRIAEGVQGSKEERAVGNIALIRACLEHGAASQVDYEEPGARLERGRAPAPALPNPRVGRNDPCPCGSGKKFKSCCGARR